MRAAIRFTVVAAVVTLGTAAWAQQQPAYDDDDEDALARQQYEQQYGQQYGQPQYGQPADVAPDVPQYGFYGPHPIPYDQGGGFDPTPGAHFHTYPPFDQYLFRQSNGWYYFVGDPGDFGYTAQTYWYNGNHPIPAGYGGGWCYITWPHRHWFAPPPGVAFNFVGGYYAYVGPWDPSYYTYRDFYTGYFGGYYRRSYYGGAYWTVRPPAVYRPSITVGAPGVYRAGVTVTAPGGGRVVVGAPVGGRVYAPAPVGGRAYAPAPVGGRVYAPAPAGGRAYAPAPAGGRVYAPAPTVAAPVRRAAPPPPPRVFAPGGRRR